MGCKMSLPFLPDWSSWGLPRLESESGETGGGQVKQYSWDKLRVELDMSQYIVDAENNTEVIRKPGSIAGQQFQIKNCINSCIFLYDWANTVTIDDCKNCKIFLGAVKSSVFLRDCSNCVLVSSCGQLRLRDCLKIDMWLCVNSQPIIESSSGVTVGCFQYWYSSIADHMTSANVSPWNNYWSQVYDFSPVKGEKNWKKAGRMFKVQDYLPLPSEVDAVKELGVTNDKSKSLVPLTVGMDGNGKIIDDDEGVILLMVANCDTREGEVAATKILNKLRLSSAGIDIIRTAKIKVRQEDGSRVFGELIGQSSKIYDSPILAFHVTGPGIGELEIETLSKMSGVIISQNIKHIQGLFSLVDIHRGF